MSISSSASAVPSAPTTEKTAPTGLEIAVIGMSCRFPGARTIGEYWENLRNGVESVSFFTPEELIAAGIPAEMAFHPNYVPAKAVAPDGDKFDMALFGYTPAEAAALDPQIRMFHECVWEALEDAGCDPDTYPGLIGLYGGATVSFNWKAQMLIGGKQEDFGSMELDFLTEKDFMISRVAYKLNLRGPAVSIQTACSTSLVAIHMACRALLTGECQVALAGGVSNPYPHVHGHMYQEGLILSPDGHCRAFDADARGVVSGSGGGVVVLKPLRAALADGDRIYAVIKGSAVNNDGGAKAGYSTPGVDGQARVIRTALKLARVDAESIGYVEAHGTGTEVGDPLEIVGLTEAFASEKRGFCRIGSVKSNFGHLDAAAGVASFIKTVLILQHGQIPPTLHFRRPNPRIDFAATPFVVNDTLFPWPDNGRPRRAGVSSFGIGGTNAHVVLEAAPPPRLSTAAPGPRLFVLSAATRKALQTRAAALADFLRARPQADAADLAWTLQTGRKSMKWRECLVAGDTAATAETLQRLSEGKGIGRLSGKVKPIFLFSGQGSQYAGMARDLYESFVPFRRELKRCLEILQTVGGVDHRPCFLSNDESTAAALNHTAVTQPVLFCLEYALASCLIRLGIQPHAMIGHSIGEYVAACLAGVFTLEEGIRLVVHRGRLMGEMAPGAMLSVMADEERVASALVPPLEVAAVNAPESIVVAGPEAEVSAFAAEMARRRIPCKRLAVSHAFHTAMMAPMLESFRRVLETVDWHKPRLPYISNVSGSWIGEEEAVSPQYWLDQLRGTVWFSRGVEVLRREQNGVFLEIGPGQALCRLVAQHRSAGESAEADVLPMIRPAAEHVADREWLLRQIGELWKRGAAVQWGGLYEGETRGKAELPPYPFEHVSYDPGRNLLTQGSLQRALPESATRIPDSRRWLYLPCWKQYHRLDNGTAPAVQPLRVLFTDRVGWGAALAEELRRFGSRVVTVTPGGHFHSLSPDAFEIPPERPEDYSLLLEKLRALSPTGVQFIHLWSIDTPAGDGLQETENALQNGFYSLVALVRALRGGHWLESCEIVAVTSDLERVIGHESGAAGQAAVLGPALVAPQELPGCRCRHLDISREDAQALTIPLLAADLLAATEPQIAYRRGRRWMKTFENLPDTVGENRVPRIKPGGVYMITGGLGAIGMQIARYLAVSARAKLVLVGRSPVPPRDSWEKPLAGMQGEIAGRLRELEEAGAEVLTFSVDVAEYADFERVVRRVEERFGRLDGIFHAAGATRGDDLRHPAADAGRERSEAQFRAKILGTLVISKILKGRDVDFCLCFSSLAAILGGMGFITYSAANAFLDALAERCGGPGKTAWISVNWEGWRAAPPEQPAQPGDEFIMYGEEGIAVLRRILALPDLSRLAVSSGDLAARRHRWVTSIAAAVPESVGEEGGENEEAGWKGREEIVTPYAAPTDDIEERLIRLWQNYFHFRQLGTADDFFQIGGDSFKAVTMAGKILREFQVEIPLSEFFQHSTIAALAQIIRRSGTKSYTGITAAEPKPHYPLSSAQKRLYVLQQFDTQGVSYNIPIVVQMRGAVARERVEYALRTIIERHEVIRTTIAMVDGEPRQFVQTDFPFSLPLTNAREEECAELVRRFIQPFDLSRAPLLRASLVQLAPERFLLMVDMHHIVSDGVSGNILIREFLDLYNGGTLPPVALQYKDYSEWQNSPAQKDAVARQAEFWVNEFPGDIPQLELPCDFVRPAVQSFAGDTRRFSLSAEECRRLKELASRQGTTLFMALLAVHYVFLSRLSGQEDIVVGSDVAGRTHPDLEAIFGMFVNTLALRNFPRGDWSFRRFLDEVKQRVLGAMENQEMQFEDLIDRLEIPRDPSRNPLFDVMFAFRNFEDRPESFMQAARGLELLPFPIQNRTAKFDLTLNAGETPDGALDLSFEYCTRLFTAETIDRFCAYFQTTVQAVLASAGEIRLQDIEIIPAVEKRCLLFEFNRTTRPLVRDKGYHELFDEQVARSPRHTAAMWRHEQVTYAELQRQSLLFADWLVRRKCRAGSLIAIYLPRSIRMLEVIIGAFRVGCGYIPLEYDYPEERIRFILENSEAGVVVTDGPGKEILHRLEARMNRTIQLLDVADLAEVTEAAPPCREEYNPNRTAYMIYTSGTTGKPKGAMVHFLGMINHLYAKITDLSLGDGDIVVQTASACFDISVWQFLAAPLVGGCTLIIDREDMLDARRFLRLLQKHRATVVELVPSLMGAFLEMVEHGDDSRLPCLRWMIPTGEALPAALARRWYRYYPETRLLNAYGPTEASDDITHYVVPDLPEEQESVPIGRPVQNMRILILDKTMRLCPIGVRGEICVSGVGVGKGYWRNPDKTAEVFVENPYAAEIDDPDHVPMYRTGDIGYFRPDGVIEFLGRRDHQVKVRGFRIELGEIEAQLLRILAIRQAVVTARDDGRGDRFLCAYLVADEPLDILALRKKLAGQLPDYMVPSYFMQLPSLPLSANGKVDRKVLPDPVGVGDEPEYIAPRNETERAVAAVWAEVLDVPEERISIDRNFFEIGGHSLKAVAVTARIHKRLGIPVPLAELFRTPTVAGLASFLAAAAPQAYREISRIGERESYAATSMQKRLFILQQLDPHGTGYNMPMALELFGPLDRKRLDAALTGLIERHESLRTSFFMSDDEPRQRVHRSVDFAVEYRETPAETVSEEIRHFIRPFDLTVAPLLRVKVLCTGADRHVLLIDMHHIVSDGLSMAVFETDFLELYRGGKLEPLRVQYRDFAEWHESAAEKERRQRQEIFWRERFADGIPVLHLPTDHPRPALQSFAGDTVDFILAGTEVERLRELAAQHGLTGYMLLLALYTILLSRISGQEDVVIGSDVAGRLHPDLNGVIGMFVNTLALRNHPRGDMRLADFLAEVKARTIEVFANQEMQFEELVEVLGVTRDASRNPLFDVMFAYQNLTDVATGEADDSLPGVQARPYPFQSRTAKFDLTLYADETEHEIRFSFEYCRDLFERATVERLAEYMRRIARAAVELGGDAPLQEINILPPAEKRFLLEEFNATDRPLPRECGYWELFQRQAELAPQRIALMHDGLECTYAELSRRATAVAVLLRRHGVQPGGMVALYMARGVSLIAAVLGTFAAGAGYIPLDPEHPLSRSRYILEDSAVRVVLTDAAGLSALWELHPPLPDLSLVDVAAADVEAGASPAADPEAAQRLAYMIYTSGTTGKPKGVMIPQYSMINHLFAKINEFGLGADDRVAQTASVCFDISVWQSLAVLLTGGAAVICERQDLLNPARFFQLLRSTAISIVQLVPSMLKMFLDGAAQLQPELPHLRCMISTAETLPPALADEWYRLFPAVDLYNVYGPTETTDNVTHYAVPRRSAAWGGVPIGRPIQNIRIFILDKYRRLCPMGTAGEICVSGLGVGRGYWGNPERTAEVFIANPHAAADAPEEHRRLYCTGDIGSIGADGLICYHGRRDHQVKIRGYRIEPAEIENEMSRIPGIGQAAVTVRQDAAGEKYLCAYVTAEEPFSPAEVRSRLAGVLPEYMIPAHVVRLATLPLSANGKVDRKALPDPVGAGDEPEYIAPRNETERAVAAVWAEVLAIPPERISVDRNFFELGGHSLKAVAVTTRIQKRLGVVVPLAEIFRTPTVSGVAAYAAQAVPEQCDEIPPAPPAGHYPLAPAQKRLYVLHQLAPQSTAYNMPMFLEISGVLDRGRLERAFHGLIRRHEAFRTSFVEIDGEPRQRIHEEVEFTLSCREESAQEARRTAAAFTRPFDLSRAPLLRVELVRTAVDAHLLLIDMHHIISDGVTMEILENDFIRLYQGLELPELRLQYKDYAVWQESAAVRVKQSAQKRFWLNELAGQIQPLNLPIDHPRPETAGTEGNIVAFSVPDEQVQALRRWMNRGDVTTFMMGVALFQVFLARLSGQEDIVVGAPVASRRHPDLEKIIGVFINTLALRGRPCADKTFADFLQEVRTASIAAFENQDYPFDELVENLAVPRRSGRHPLFDVLFALVRTTPVSGGAEPPFAVKEYEGAGENLTTKFDLTLTVIDDGVSLGFTFQYSTRLFRDETITRFCQYFRQVTAAVTADPHVRIGDIRLGGEFFADKLETPDSSGDFDFSE